VDAAADPAAPAAKRGSRACDAPALPARGVACDAPVRAKVLAVARLTGAMRAALVLGGVALVLCGCSSEDAKVRHFEKGREYVTAHKLSEAILEFRNALAVDPNWGEARFALAEAYDADSQPERAYREYVRAADLLPRDATAQLKAARYQLRGKLFEDARSRTERLLANEPNNVEALTTLSDVLVAMGDPEGALAQVEKAITIDPSRSRSYASLAQIHQAQKRNELALAAYAKAIELDPRSISTHLALADFHRATGNLEAAEQALKRAHAIDATDIATHRALAAFYKNTPRHAEAAPHLEFLARTTGTVDDRLALADFYLVHHRLQESRAIIVPMATQPNTMAAAETRLARLDYLEGQTASAAERLQRVLALDPNHVNALVLSAERALAERRYQDAHWESSAAITSNPKLAAAYYVRGQAEVKMGRTTAAIASYNEIVRMNADAVDAKVALSRLHLARNAVDTAVLYAEEALANAPSNLDARLALIRAWIARNDDGLATSELARLRTGGAASAEMATLEGALALKRNDAAAARSAFVRALQLDPSSREALTALTTMDLSRRDFADARARTAAALAADPYSVDLLVLAARVSAAAGERSETESFLRRAIALDPLNITSFALLAQLFREGNRLKAAAAEFDGISQREPGNVWAPMMAAIIVHTAGETADAERRYQQILKLEPRAALAANNLAAIFLERGEQLGYATEIATHAVEQRPDEGEFLDTLGSLYYKREMYSAAIKHFLQAVAAGPTNAVFQYHLGLAYAKNAETERAGEAFRSALRLNPRFSAARQALTTLSQ
jgi:tetratricopeptide (TPR) repeat protein